jgi:hypothetical protein
MLNECRPDGLLPTLPLLLPSSSAMVLVARLCSQPLVKFQMSPCFQRTMGCDVMMARRGGRRKSRGSQQAHVMRVAHTHTHTDTDTDRQTDRHTHTHTHTHTWRTHARTRTRTRVAHTRTHTHAHILLFLVVWSHTRTHIFIFCGGAHEQHLFLPTHIYTHHFSLWNIQSRATRPSYKKTLCPRLWLSAHNTCAAGAHQTGLSYLLYWRLLWCAPMLGAR